MATASGIRLGKVFVEIGADASKLFGALNKLNKRIGSIGREMTNLGGRMTAVGGALAAPLALASRQFATFDDAIRATAAVTGSLGPQGAASLAMLNDKARELGATTSFTAVQVANLMTELGRAGFKPDEINTMTGAVLDLARATGTDATLSAGIMASTLRQFGLGATDAAHAADLLTYAANSSFNTVEGLGESLKFAGPVAKNLGMSLEDTVGILGVLGNVGIQGSEAGTALRRLGVITAGAGDELQALFGVSNVDAAGNLKPLVDILDEINTATSTMSVAERTEKMAKAFGLLGITSANVLAGSAPSVRSFIDGMANIDKLSNKTAKAMDAGLGGSMRIALSAIEGTSLALGEALAPSLQAIIDGIARAAGGITKFVSGNEELVVSVAKGLAIFGGVGLALTALGATLSLASFAAGGLLAAFVSIPAAVAASIASLVAYSFAAAAAGLKTLATGIWIASTWGATALTGVLSFVASSAIAFASYLASAGATAAASATFGIATAAAWVAPLAPLLAIGVALAAVAAGAYASLNTFSAMPGFIMQAAEGIGGTLVDAISSAMAVFADLFAIGKETFSGIYAAIAEGDVAGAMDVLWLGLYAGWLRGVEALMGAVDPWISLMQNSFSYLAAGILTVWDGMANGLAMIWDNLEGRIRKGWNYIQSFIQSGFDLEKENAKVDNEMSARARDREMRTADHMANADQIAADREQANADRAGARRRATQAAEANLSNASRGKRETAARNDQFGSLLKDITSATTMDELLGLSEEFDALSANGRLTAEQVGTLEEALADAQVRMQNSDMTAGGRLAKKAATAAAGAGGAAAAQSASEVAGTFSSVGLGGMGFGGNLQQQQLDTLKEIANNTKDMEGGAIGE